MTQKPTIHHRWRFYASCLSAAALTACGGGSGSDLVKVDPAHPLTPTLNCSTADLQSSAPGATLTAAVMTTATSTGKTYCKVDGYITTQGPAATSNQVRFTVALPATFLGRYYFAGVGGSAGALPPPNEAMLSDGYAMAGTDAGSPTPGVNWTFATDRTKAYDWAQRGVHVSTTATQALTRAYFGLDKANGNRRMYRYIDGCSGGGRMGIVSASWHPDDFDGVIAGAPGINTANVLMFGKVAKYLKDHPDAWISPGQLQQLDAMLVLKFDAADDATDGLISDPSKVTLDDSMWALFTPAQQETLRMVLAGMNDFGLVYPGFTLGNPIAWSAFLLGGVPPSSWSFTAGPQNYPPAGHMVFDSQSRGLFGLTYDYTTQLNFTSSTDVLGWNSKFEEVFTGSATAKAADLSNYFQRGGKVLFWHGAADNGISLNDTLRFHGDLTTTFGGAAQLAQNARLFVAPGVHHCAGGIGPQDVPKQALVAITEWVENGAAPSQLVTNRAKGTLPARSFLLCPHPQRAVFRGGVSNTAGLDVNDASNWSCQQP